MASLTFSSSLFKILTFTLSLWVLFGTTSGQLSPSFYSSTCPLFTPIVTSAVTSAILQETRMGASLLRLHFLDCFVNGCDASVLLDDTEDFTGEKTASQINNSARGFDVIDNIKTQLELTCPGVVSCVDILAAAAQVSVVALGGPSWSVTFGRRDSTTASLLQVLAISSHPLQQKDSLSGAHTIGEARCTNFSDHVYNENNIDPSFATSLKAICPSSGGNLSPLEASSSTSFDNRYFSNLNTQKGLLHSDQQLYNAGLTDAQVRTYASNQPIFFRDFANAMVKMGHVGALTGSNGEIRANCRKTSINN